MEAKRVSRSFYLFVIFSVLTVLVYSVCLTVFVSLLARDHWALQSYAIRLEQRLGSIERIVNKKEASRWPSSTTTHNPDASNDVERHSDEADIFAAGRETESRSKRDQVKTCNGCKGKRGRRGKKGILGAQGPPGPKGDSGPEGREGTRGIAGPRGPKGDPATKDNSTMIAESVHLVGDGNRKRHAGIVKYWNKKHSKGLLRYNKHTGELVIGRTGFYYVYSQMYYYDGSTIVLNHYTLRNGQRIMGSASSVVNPKRKYNTNYHGGVFLLEKGDRISISVFISKVYLMMPEYSYFGAFMIHLA